MTKENSSAHAAAQKKPGQGRSPGSDTKSDTKIDRGLDMDCDIAVIGSGLAGLTTTALLAAHDISVCCLDKTDMETQLSSGFDGRTTAVSFGSRQIFEAIGLWDKLAEKACPIDTIHILDGDSPVLLAFDKEEVGGRTFGWIIENRYIRNVLYDYIKSRPSATFAAPVTITDFEFEDTHARLLFKSRDALNTKLVVGADGRNSFTREYLGITSREWSYKQRALVFNVLHENPHENIAVEHFMPDGPFAILPMTDTEEGRHRSSVVWTEHGPERDSARYYSEKSFNAALNKRFPDRYGAVELTGERFFFPLGLVHAHHYIGPRTALVADAAHGIHPIAGQGLNLGFRDIAALADLAVTAVREGRDPGAQDLLKQYQRRRRFDNMAMAGATDSLNRLFSNDITPVRILRQTGLKLVSRLPFAKKFFMKQAMGTAGLLPDLIRDSAQEREAA